MYQSMVSTELKNDDVLNDRIDKLRPFLDKMELRKKFPDRWQHPVLFVDEIHQATQMDRASLLRVLEDNKIRQSVKEDPIKIGELIWLFAASETRDELLMTCKPPDFWTRMDQIIELKHPLNVDPDESEFDGTRQRVLQDYFWRFWRGTDTDAEKEIEEELSPVRKRVLKYLLSDDAFRLATRFAQCLGAPLIDVFSVRYIRGMAKRIKGQAVLLGLETSPIDKKTFLKAAEKSMEGWTVKAFKDMVKTLKMDDVEKQLKKLT
jgi:hypothetical protein